MNKEMSIRDMEELRDSYARRFVTYARLAWKVKAGRCPDCPATWKRLKFEAMKKARHFAKVVKEMSAQ